MQTARKNARKKHFLRPTVSILLALALVLLGSAIPVIAAGELPLTVSGVVQHDMTLLILDEINRVRAEQDPPLDPLEVEAPLQDLADMRSFESLLYDADFRPDTSPVEDSILEIENATRGFEIRDALDMTDFQSTDIEALVADWLSDPAREAILLSPELKTIGIGTYSHPEFPEILLTNALFSDADLVTPYDFEAEQNMFGAIEPKELEARIMLSPELASPVMIEEAQQPEPGVVVYRASMQSRIPDLILDVPADALEWSTDDPAIGTFTSPGVLTLNQPGPVNILVNSAGVPIALVPVNITEDQLPTLPPTEPTTEAPTEPPTEAPTEPPTEAPTEPPTEAPTEPPTEAPTEPPTEAPTEPPTEAPTEPPTEAPTEPPTEPTPEPTQSPEPLPYMMETEIDGSLYYDLAKSLLDRINALREGAGLQALVYDYAGQSYADARAVESLLWEGHVGQNGVYYDYENLYSGNVTDPETIIQDWLSDQGNFERMMNPDYTAFALGEFRVEGADTSFFSGLFTSFPEDQTTGPDLPTEAVPITATVKVPDNNPQIYIRVEETGDPGTRQLTAYLLAEDGKTEIPLNPADIDWTVTGDPDVTVDENGLLTGTTAGTIQISASLKDQPDLISEVVDIVFTEEEIPPPTTTPAPTEPPTTTEAPTTTPAPTEPPTTTEAPTTTPAPTEPPTTTEAPTTTPAPTEPPTTTEAPTTTPAPTEPPTTTIAPTTTPAPTPAPTTTAAPTAKPTAKPTPAPTSPPTVAPKPLPTGKNPLPTLILIPNMPVIWYPNVPVVPNYPKPVIPVPGIRPPQPQLPIPTYRRPPMPVPVVTRAPERTLPPNWATVAPATQQTTAAATAQTVPPAIASTWAPYVPPTRGTGNVAIVTRPPAGVVWTIPSRPTVSRTDQTTRPGEVTSTSTVERSTALPTRQMKAEEAEQRNDLPLRLAMIAGLLLLAAAFLLLLYRFLLHRDR